ncbi:MAG: FABP family protein [Micrococcales bacterium]
MFVIPDDLPIEVTPFAFLLGKWQGSGKIVTREHDQAEAVEVGFTQNAEFTHDGQDTVTYVSTVTLDDGRIMPGEIGYWRLTRAVHDSDAGPGLLPGVGPRAIQTREDLETQRNQEGGFDIQVSMLHPGGVAELYHGKIKGARIDLASFSGTAFDGAKTYRHSVRVYGLVNHNLMWAWDIATRSAQTESHASAELHKIETAAEPSAE